MLPEDEKNVVRFEDYHQKKAKSAEADGLGGGGDDWGLGPSSAEAPNLRQGADDWDDLSGGGGGGFRLGGDDGEAVVPTEPDYPQYSPQERRQRAARCVGCCCGLFLIGLAVLSVGGWEYQKYLESRADPFVNQFADQGYVIRRGETLALTEPPEKNTLLLATQVTIEADTGVDLAIRAKICEIKSKLGGKVLVQGEVLNIGAKAEVADLEVQVQRINRAGKVKKMTGSYKTLVEP